MSYFPSNPSAWRSMTSAWPRSIPAVMWWEPMLKVWETSVAAPKVIGHRTGRMAAAGLFPGLADQREFTLMGTEKMVAFSQAYTGAWMEMLNFQLGLMLSAMSYWGKGFNPVALMEMWHSPNALMNAQAGLAKSLMMSGSARMLSAMPRTAHKVIAPIHAKATGNVKRLARKRK